MINQTAIFAVLTLFIMSLMLVFSGCSPEKPSDRPLEKPTLEDAPLEEQIDESIDTDYLDSQAEADASEESLTDSDTNEDAEKDQDLIVDSKDKPESVVEKREELLKGDVIYKVVVGEFDDKNSAENLYKKLKADGFEIFLAVDEASGKVLYKIQAGAFSNRKNAEEIMTNLKEKGYDPQIIEEKKK